MIHDIWQFILGLGVCIIAAHCAGWWFKAAQKAKDAGAVSDKPVVVWPGDPDYDMTAMDFEADAFHEECGDR